MEYKLSASAFNQYETVSLTNEIPHMSTYSILNKHIQMDWSRDIIGQVRTFYDDRESVKLVDGVQSPNYTSEYVKVIDSNGNVIEGYIPKVNFEISGGFEKEMDYLMHEMHRYLFRSYPEHSNALITLTKAERQSYFNEAEHMLDSFWDTENIPSNSELEDFYLKHKFLTNITVARKYCGSSKEEDILIHLFGVPATFTGAKTFVDDKQDKVVALASGLVANTDFNKIYRYYTTLKAATSFESDTFANLTTDFTSFVKDIVVAKELLALEGILFDFAITDDPITPIITNLNNILEYGSVNGSTIKKDGTIDPAGGKRGSISSSMVLSDVISDQIFGKYSANIISDADYAELSLDFNTRVTLGSDNATNVVPYQGTKYNTEIVKACENKFLTREVTFAGLKDAIVLKTGAVCYNKVFVKWFTHLCASELAKAYIDEQSFGVNYSANRRMQYNFDVQFDLVESKSNKPVITGFLNRNLISSIPESKQFVFDFTNPQDDWLDPKEFFQCLSHPGDCEYINFGNGDEFGLKISFNVWEDQRKDPQGNPIGYVSDVVGNPPTSGVFNPVVLLDYVSTEGTESGIPFLPRGVLTPEGSVQFYGLNYLRQIETVPIYFLNKAIYLEDNWLTSINTIELPIEGGFSLYERIMDLATTTVESKTSDDGKIIYFIRKYELKDEYLEDPYKWATSEILNAFAVNTETIIKQIGRSEEVSAQSLAKYNAEMVDETTIRLREDIKNQVMRAGRLEFMLIDAKAQRHFGYLKDSYIKNDYCYCTIGDVYPPLGFAGRNVLTCYLYVKGDPIDSREEDRTKFRRGTTVRAAAYDNKYYYETTWRPLSDDNLRWYCDSFTSSKADSYIEQDNNFTIVNELYDPATLTEYESLTLVSCDPKFIKPITDLINENKSLYIDSSIKFVSHIPLIQGTTAHSKEYNTISAMFTDTVPNYITFYDIDIKDFPEFEGFYNATVDPNLKDIHYVETIVNRSLIVWGNSIWDGTADETTKKLRTIWGGYFSNFIVKDLRDYLPDSYTSIHSIGSNSSVSIKLDNYNYACNEGEPERLWNLVYSPSGGVNSSVHMQVIDYYANADHLGKDWKEYRPEQTADEPEELASILKPTGGKIPVIDLDDTYGLSVEKQSTSGEYKYEIETVPLDFHLKFDWTGNYLYQCKGLLDNQTLGIRDGVSLVTHSGSSNVIQDIKLVDHQIHYEEYWNPLKVFQIRYKPIEAYLVHMLYEYTKVNVVDSNTELTMSGFTDYLASLSYLPAIAYLEEDKLRLAVFNTTKDTNSLLITIQDFGIPISMHIITELFGKSCTGFEFENNATMRKVIAALSPTIYNIPNSTWTGRLKETQINLTNSTAIGLTKDEMEDGSIANDSLEVSADPNLNTLNRVAIFHKDGDERKDWDIKKKINQSDKVTIEEGKDNAKLIRVEDLMEHSLGKSNPYGVFKFQENNKYFKEFTRESITLSATNNGNEYMDCTIDFGRNEDMEFDGGDEILLYAIRGPLIRSVYTPSKETQLIERGYAIGNLNVVSYDKTEGGIYLADSSATSLSSVSKAISDLKGVDNSDAELRKFVTDIVKNKNTGSLPDNLTKDAIVAKVCENVYSKNYDNNIVLIGSADSESVKNKYTELKTTWPEKIKHQEITVNSAEFGIKWPSPLKDIGYTFYKRKFVTEGVVYASEPNKVYIDDAAIILRDHIGGGDEVELIFIDSLSKDNPKTQVSLNVDMSNYPGPYKLLAYNAASEQEMSDEGESIAVTTLYAYVGWQRGIAKITIKDTVEVAPYGVEAPLTYEEGGSVGKLQNCSPFTLNDRFYYTCVYTNGASVTFEAKPGALSPTKDIAILEPGELHSAVELSSEEEFQKYYSFGLAESEVPSAVDAISLSEMQIVTDNYGRKIKVTHNSEGNVYELIEDAAYLERFPVVNPKNVLSNSAKKDYLDWLSNVFSVDGKLEIPVITPDDPTENEIAAGGSESFSQSEDVKYLAELLFLKDEKGNYLAQGMSITDALAAGYLLAPNIEEITTGAFTLLGTKKQTVPCITYNGERLVPAGTNGDILEAQNWYSQMLSLLDTQSTMRLNPSSSTFSEGEEWVVIIDKGGCLFAAWNKRTGVWVRLGLQNFLGYSTTSSSYPSNYITDIPVLFNTVTAPDRKIWDDYKDAVVQSKDLQQWIIRNATTEVVDPESEDGKGTKIEWIAPFSEDTKTLEEFNEEMMVAFNDYIAQMNAADRLAPNMLNKIDNESAFSLRKLFTAATQNSDPTWDPLPYPFPFTSSTGEVITKDYFYGLQDMGISDVRSQQLKILSDYYGTLEKNADGSLVDPTKWDARAKLRATIEFAEKSDSDVTGIENYLPSNTSVQLGDLVAIGPELNLARKLTRGSGSVHSLINNVGVLVDSEEGVGIAYVYGTVNYSAYTNVSDDIKLNIISSHNNISTNHTAEIENFTPISEATFLLKINLANNEVSVVPMADNGALIQSIVPTNPGYKVVWRDPSNSKNICVQEVNDLSKITNTEVPEFVEMNSNPSPDPFKGVEMLLLETLDENLKVEVDEFSFDEDRFKTATVSSIQNRTFEDEGDCIILRNSSISFNNIPKARAVVLVSDPSRDNFQFPYGSSMNFASQVPEALTIFEVDDAKYADFAATINRFDYDQSTLSRVDVFLNQYSIVGEKLKTTKSIYPFITDIDTDGSNVDLLKKFYKLDDNNQPKLMRNDLGRQIIRIVPMGFRLPLTEKDDNGFVRLAAFNSEGFLMRRGKVLNKHYSIYEGDAPNRLFQWDTDHFSYRYLQENEDGTTEEISKEVVEGENVVSADAYVQTSMLLGKSYSELMMLTDSNSKAVLFAGVYEMVDNPRQAVLDNPYKVVSAEIDAQTSSGAQPNALTIEDNYIRIQMLNNSFVENVVPSIEPDASYRNANERVRPNLGVVNEDFSVTDDSELVNGGIVLMNLNVKVVTKTNSYPRLVPITNYKVNTTGDNTYIDSESTELYIPTGGYGQTLTGNYTYPEENLFVEGTFFNTKGFTKNKSGQKFTVVDKDTLEVRNDKDCPKLVYGSFLKADKALPVKLATRDSNSSYNAVIIPLDGLVLGKHSITFPNASNLPWLVVDKAANSDTTIFNFEGTYNLFTSGATFSCKMIRKNSKVDVNNTTDVASYEDISILSESGTEKTRFSTEELIKHLDYTRLYAGDAISDLPKYTRYFDAHSRQIRLTGGNLLRDSDRRACNSQGLIYKVNNLGQLTTDPIESGEWAYAVRRDSNSDVYQLENILRDFTYTRGADKVRSLYSIPFKFENKTFEIDGNSIIFSTNPNFVSVYTYENLKGVGAEFNSIICEDDGSAEVTKEEKYKLNFNTDLSYEFDAIFSTAFTRYNFAVMRDKNNKVVGTVYFGDYIDSDYVMIFSNV